MFLLLTAILGPQSNHRGSSHSRGHGGSDWSWLTGSGSHRQSRGHSGLASDFTSALTSGGWVWGYSTKARQPGKKHGWFI
jgi:hypothetical protein